MTDHSRSLSHQGILVKRCGCGGIHVSLGGVSLNLAQETARALMEELEKACNGTRQIPLISTAQVKSSPH